MRQKEQRLFDTFKRKCPKDIWLQRVENMVVVGMPDLTHLVLGGTTGWIELKSPIAPRKASTRLLGDEGLNVDQINWHLKYTQMGGDSWVLIRDDRMALFMIHGRWAADMNQMTALQLSEIACATDWEDVIAVIRNRHQPRNCRCTA